MALSRILSRVDISNLNDLSAFVQVLSRGLSRVDRVDKNTLLSREGGQGFQDEKATSGNGWIGKHEDMCSW